MYLSKEGSSKILRPSYLHNGISFTSKTTSLYWVRALLALCDPLVGPLGSYAPYSCTADRGYLLPDWWCVLCLQLIADLLAAHTPENHIAQPVATDVTAENPTSSQTQPEATTTSNTDTHMDISEPTVQSSSSGQDVIISSNTESSENKTESDQSHKMDDNSSRADNPSESLNKSCSTADNPSEFINKSSCTVNKPSEFINKSESMAGHPSDPVTKSIASSTSAACSRSSDSVSGTDDDLPQFDPAKVVVDPSCSFCGVKYEDPKPHNLVMYLHAHSYKVGGYLKSLALERRGNNFKSVIFKLIFTPQPSRLEGYCRQGPDRRASARLAEPISQ